MNRRILKKLSKRAMVLLEQYCPGRFEFDPARGDETIDAPTNMPKRELSSEHFTEPLKGTPLIWQRTSHEYDEWDAFTAWDIWLQVKHWEIELTGADIAEMIAEITPCMEVAA